MSVDIQPACLGLYCGRTVLSVNGSVETYGDFGVCPRGQRTDEHKICRECMGSPDRYDWLYLGFMAMLPLVLHWFFIEWYSGKKSSSALLQHLTKTAHFKESFFFFPQVHHCVYLLCLLPRVDDAASSSPG
uniref:JNK1/MAPK8 associated membrane protein n=1 Tax=Malurus cyaneus samueli TaxID=2593467 RepID=A0A8C5U6J4_9PASS